MSKVLFFLGTVTITLNGVRPFLNMTLSDLFYFAALFFLMIERVVETKGIKHWMPFHVLWPPACLVLVGGLLSSIDAAQPSTSITVSFKIWFLFSIWMSMGIAMVRSKGQGKNILIAFLTGATFTSAVAVWDFLTGMEVGPTIYGLHSAESVLFPVLYIQSAGRFSGTFGHPNHLGQLTAIAIPLSLDLAWSAWKNKRGILRVLALGMMTFVILCANILSGSISGLAGAMLAVMFLIAVRIAIGRHLILTIGRLGISALGAGFILFLIAQVVSDTEFIAWISGNLNRVVTTTGEGRLRLMQETWSMILSNPLLGYGMDQGDSSLSANQLVTSIGVHNTILQSWIGGGFIAFVGVVLIYWETLKLAMRSVIAHGREYNAPYALGLSASIIGSVFMDMNQPSIYIRYAWITVALLYGLYQGRHNHLRMGN